jgi:Tfp pilus assembly protein PilZ
MMRERQAVRFVPQRPVTVAIEKQGTPFAYGVVANISEGGACILTNARLAEGQRVQMRLSFSRQPQPVLAEGFVVWGAPRAGQVETRGYGLRWAGAGSPVPGGYLSSLL